MVNVYVRLIQKGLRTLKDVPKRFRDDVAIILEDQKGGK